MQIRGLLIAAIALGLLAGGVYWSERAKNAEENKPSATKLVSIETEDIRKIEVRRAGTPPVMLERGNDNKWQMSAPQNWKVDESEVNAITSAYAALSYDRMIDEAGADAAGYGLGAPVLEVTVTGKDGKARKLQIGEETPTGTGSYARFEGDPKIFTLGSGVKGSFDKSPKDLRDKRLLVFDPEKLTGLTLTTRSAPIAFSRAEGGDWQIEKPRPQRADNGQVEELVRKLADARMDTTVPDEEAPKIAASFYSATRVATAAVTDPTGTQNIDIRKRGTDYYARSSAVDGVFKIAADIGEGVNKTLADFQNKKLFDFGFTEPDSLTIRDDAKTYAFTKSGEQWTDSNNRQMDPTSVQNLIDKLRDLTAIRFLESGFTTPVVEVSVTSGSNKRLEKVAISKTGNMFYAKRENEPTVYELDSKAVQEIQQAAADVKAPPPPPQSPPTK